MAFSHPGARERPPREKIYKEAGEKSKDLISKRFPKMMEVLLFLCVDPGHFLSTTSFLFTVMRIFLRWAMKRIFLRVMMRATHIYCFKCLVGRARCPPRPISMHWVGSYGQVAALYFNINSFSARGCQTSAGKRGSIPGEVVSFCYADPSIATPLPSYSTSNSTPTSTSTLTSNSTWPPCLFPQLQPQSWHLFQPQQYKQTFHNLCVQRKTQNVKSSYQTSHKHADKFEQSVATCLARDALKEINHSTFGHCPN